MAECGEVWLCVMKYAVSVVKTAEVLTYSHHGREAGSSDHRQERDYRCPAETRHGRLLKTQREHGGPANGQVR